MTLKQTLAGLLDTRFKTCDSEEQKAPPDALITIDEVLESWHCHRVTVLRLMRRGLLHPLTFEGELV